MRQVGHLPELYEGARSENKKKNKIKLPYIVIDGKITLHFILRSRIRIYGVDLSGLE